MVKHSEQFLKKQKLKKEFEKKLSQIKLEIQQKMFDEILEKKRLNLEIKKQKKIDAENKKKDLLKEKIKKRYEEMKTDDKRYKAYLESQKKYREKYKLIKLEKSHKNILDKIGNNDYSIFNYDGKKLYVTSDGRFFKENGNEILGSKTCSNYVRICFNHKIWLAHRLVWEAFKGEIPEGMEIDHKNGERYDNRLCNLSLCSHKDNCNNPISIENYKRHNKEVDRSYLKKTVYQYTIDGTLVNVWESGIKAAQELGFYSSEISKCCLGKKNTYKNFKWSFENKSF